MIAAIRGGTKPEERAGYLALSLTEEDTWTAVDGTVQQSADEAGRQCITDLEARVALLDTSYDALMRSVRSSLARLWDAPRPGDHVFVNGHRCHIEADGSIVVPPPIIPSLHVHLQDQVTDSVYETLRAALDLPSERKKATGLIIDLVLQESFDVLVKVDAIAPDQRDTITQFAITLNRLADEFEEPLVVEVPHESDEGGTSARASPVNQNPSPSDEPDERGTP